MNREGRTRFSWIRAGYELVTPKHNLVTLWSRPRYLSKSSRNELNCVLGEVSGLECAGLDSSRALPAGCRKVRVRIHSWIRQMTLDQSASPRSIGETLFHPRSDFFVSLSQFVRMCCDLPKAL